MPTEKPPQSTQGNRRILLEEELIRRAERGDAEAGHKLLTYAVERIEAGLFDSPVFEYLAKGLSQFLEQGIPLDRALSVEIETNRGGRPPKYDRTEIAAVDLLLRDHAGFSPEAANSWISENLGADRRLVQKVRKEFDARHSDHEVDRLAEALELDDLLVLAGSLRQKLAEVLPHT